MRKHRSDKGIYRSASAGDCCGRKPVVEILLSKSSPFLAQLPDLISLQRLARLTEGRYEIGVGTRLHGVDDRFAAG